jgi:hypothetical protein
MKRLGIAAASVLLLAVVVGAAQRVKRGQPDVCDGFTPAKMLEDPEFAREYIGALHGDRSAARAHLEAIVSELRAVHGCGGAAEDRGAVSDPPAASPGLPPGHPPIDGAPVTPDLGDSATKTWTI